MIPIFRNPETVVRSIAIAVIFFAIAGVYRLGYVPNGQAVSDNLDEVKQLLTEVNAHEDVPNKYQLLRQELRKELEQKGIQEEEQWLVRSDTDLHKQLLRILKANSTKIKKCEINATGGDANPRRSGQVAIEFQCDLPQLFRVLQETDKFPSNVKVNSS